MQKISFRLTKSLLSIIKDYLKTYNTERDLTNYLYFKDGYIAYTDGYQGRIIRFTVEEYLIECPNFEFALSPENAKLLVAVNNDTLVLFDEDKMYLEIPTLNLSLPVIYKDDIKHLFQHFVNKIDNAEYKVSVNPKIIESVFHAINALAPTSSVDIYRCEKSFLITQDNCENIATFNEVKVSGNFGLDHTLIRNIRDITDSYNFLISEDTNNERNSETGTTDTDDADNSDVSDNNEGNGTDTAINEEGDQEEAN